MMSLQNEKVMLLKWCLFSGFTHFTVNKLGKLVVQLKREMWIEKIKYGRLLL